MTTSRVRTRLAELRAVKGWSQERLAQESGVSKSTILRLESEKTTRVDFDTLGNLADALGCDPGYLLVRVGPRRK